MAASRRSVGVSRLPGISLALAFACCASALPANGQAPRRDAGPDWTQAGAAAQERRAEALRAHPGVVFLASALAPGAGQYLLGDQRWVPYLAVELWAWRSVIDHRREARDLADQYREVAWAVARRVGTGERRDTVFEYYENLIRWSASGAFDRDPRADELQPETNPNTYNGYIWSLARAIYIPPGRFPQPGSPEYERALAYYREHAVPDGFAWAWGDNVLEQQVFASLIAESDAAYRRSSRVLGFILANHVVSAIDALVAARFRAAGSEPPLRIRGGLEGGDADGLRWRATLTYRP